jgi:hypothetical protein
MSLDFSAVDSTIFIASISAAGLMYTAGSVMRGGVFRDIENQITTMITFNVIIFLISNFLIMIYWIYNIILILNFAGLLYLFGLILMIYTVIISFIYWRKISKIPQMFASHAG